MIWSKFKKQFTNQNLIIARAAPKKVTKAVKKTATKKVAKKVTKKVTKKVAPKKKAAKKTTKKAKKWEWLKLFDNYFSPCKFKKTNKTKSNTFII